MRQRKPWCTVPAEPIITLLPNLKWRAEAGIPASANAAALILYVVLAFEAERVETDDVGILGQASVSYTELATITGLSRALISAGLKRLVGLNLVTASGSNQKQVYLIAWNGGRWFKLPCQAIFRDGKINAFRQLSLRSRRDLYALKLYLYFASVRDHGSMFSMASHEKIHKKTGIPENEIRRAHSLLTSVGLLAGVDREFKGLERTNEPNKYYLTGWQAFGLSTANAA